MEEEGPGTLLSAPSSSYVMLLTSSSSNEPSRSVTPSRSSGSVLHVFWDEKTPNQTVTSAPISVQRAMAFRFVDPTPFLPHGSQRMMIDGRPTMRRVVIGHVAPRNNDLAIAVLQPLPQGQVNFMDIRNILDDFLHNHAAVGYRMMQPCPFG